MFTVAFCLCHIIFKATEDAQASAISLLFHNVVHQAINSCISNQY